MNLPVQYTIINSAVNMSNTVPEPKKILKTIHNAGFFSCATIRLMDIVTFWNDNGCLPDEVDSSEQFLHYKSSPGDNMIPFYYNQDAEICRVDIEPNGPISLPDCMAIQFGAYRNLPSELNQFVFTYFEPSEHVDEVVYFLTEKYGLDYENLCAVFYRGNDKATEMVIPSYQMFIDKAKEVKAANPEIRFLVQPDEREFLEAFLVEFPDSIYFEETPMLNKSNTCMFFEVPVHERAEYGKKFFAAVLCLSQCAHVITHSGNGALWLALYRGNCDNLHQVFNNEWI